ncbi:MAG TPA: sigma-54 dependent transcriptional regulator [Candidatus Acidoferrales bacterium]
MNEPQGAAAESAVRVVLVAEAAAADMIRSALDGLPLDFYTALEPALVTELVQRRQPRIVLLDCAMAAGQEFDLLDRILDLDPGLDVLFLGADGSTEAAVEAIQRGAADFLSRPLDTALLRDRVGRLITEFQKRRRSFSLDSELLHQFSFEGIVGRSVEMLELFDRISRIGPHFQSVLVTGETGTGKELVAQALHRRSPQSSGPFVACNCSAIVETLFESELFGHVRGAFTGAIADRVGLLEYANGGTLFLDEIGDMPLTTQVKLLRALQTREVQRVGSPAVRKVNVRVVAATNRDLGAMVEHRQFRDDLYHRLAAIELRLPRLASRREDLPLLTRYFLERISTEHGKRVSGLTRRAQALLVRYHWPGNVRELENVLRHAAMLVEGSVIDVRDLPDRLRAMAAGNAPSEQRVLTLAEVERRHAREVLDAMRGNKVRAAKALGISRATLYKLLEEPTQKG